MKPEQTKSEAINEQLESWAVEQDPKRYNQLYRLGQLALKRSKERDESKQVGDYS